VNGPVNIKESVRSYAAPPVQGSHATWYVLSGLTMFDSHPWVSHSHNGLFSPQRCRKRLSCGHQCPSVCGEGCPDARYCVECGSDDIKARVVDMIMLATYADHDVDDDPIVFLSCAHFFAASTLDGQLGMNQVYRREDASGAFIGLLPLRDADITEKPKCCPECRTHISGVLRYGRLLQFSGLRVLERKHMADVGATLNAIQNNMDNPKMATVIDEALERIERSPMRLVFEACAGSADIEPSPPTVSLIRGLGLRAKIYGKLAVEKDDTNYKVAHGSFVRAIEVATSSSSYRSVAELRIAKVEFLVKFETNMEIVRNEAMPVLEWVILNCPHFEDLVKRARDLRTELSKSISREEIAEIVRAMSGLRQGGYDGVGSASAHWYECPNGHPYFIGECGGAMQTGQCYECGEAVGGTGHRLNSTNRQAGGLVREALAD